jgi:PTH1 family peptidyl-tRNA hydrolase
MSEKRLLIAGLGNPGGRYAKNRHNAGFLALEGFASSLSETTSGVERTAGKKWNAEVRRCTLSSRGGDLELILVWPLLFMNRSGGPISGILKSYEIPVERMLVIHDEIELAFGDIRLKVGGGHKGHNGLRDIIESCGADFSRLRFGVGRPEHGEIADYVLSNFTSDEQALLPELFARAGELILNWMKGHESA